MLVTMSRGSVIVTYDIKYKKISITLIATYLRIIHFNNAYIIYYLNLNSQAVLKAIENGIIKYTVIFFFLD